MAIEKNISPNSEVFIIGSGITGLTTGAILAKNGLNVRILEAHPNLLGGQARSFKESGFWFCGGPQYVWNFREGNIGRRMLKYLKLEHRIPFDPMNENGFERCIIGDDDPIDIPMGLDGFQDMLFKFFPDEQRKIRKFFEYVKDFFNCWVLLDERALYREKASKITTALLGMQALPIHAKMRTLLFSPRPLKILFDRCGISERLRRVLYSHGGIFLENESTVSSVVYGASTGCYHAGAYFPRYGFRSLIGALVNCVRENGGAVETNKCVTKLSVKHGRIVTGCCGDGEEFRPDLVISNVAPKLMAKIMENNVPLRFNYTPSHTVNSMFIGLEKYPGLREMFDGRNIWWQDGNGEVEYHNVDMTLPPRMLYVCSPSCNGNENKNDNPDMHSLMVFTPANYKEAKHIFEKNGNDYEELRAHIIENHLSQLEKRVLPNIRTYIKYIKLLTPLEIEQETFAEQGGVYGRRPTPKSLLTCPLSNSGAENLWFACAATGSAGIAPGMQTAAWLTSELTGIKI
jgi:phytoene dehydrogenase-like protein